MFLTQFQKFSQSICFKIYFRLHAFATRPVLWWVGWGSFGNKRKNQYINKVFYGCLIVCRPSENE